MYIFFAIDHTSVQKLKQTFKQLKCCFSLFYCWWKRSLWCYITSVQFEHCRLAVGLGLGSWALPDRIGPVECGSSGPPCYDFAQSSSEWRRKRSSEAWRTVSAEGTLSVEKKYFVSETLWWKQLSHTVVNRGLGDISYGSSLHDVSDDKLLDCLILGHASGTVGASDSLYVATSLLGASSVSSLGSLMKR